MINEEIRDREVRVVDQNGAQLGIMSTHQALLLAEERQLDLVKIAPQARPPVCKLMDYGKYRFEQSKREREIRKNQKVITIKEVRLSATIEDHDVDVKFKNAIFFTARITNTVITILAFYTMDRTILVALALIVVGDVITVVMALLRMKRMPNPMKADLRFAAKIVPFGFISMVTTLMLTLNYRVDTLMMGYLYHIPDTEIGFYSLGVSLSEYGWLIPDAFREVLFSRTAKDDAIEEVTMSMKVNFYLTLLMILGILLLGRPVIRILAGAEYLPAYPVTVMLIAGIIPMSYFKIIGTLLLAQGKKGVYLGMLSASVLVNILCNMLTIPLWGKMGAAVASVVSYAVAGLVFLGYYLRTYSIPLSAVFVFSPAEKAKLMNKLGAVKRKLGKKKTA